MSTRKFSFAVGEFYHLYNRGNDRREIFRSDADRDRFIRLLFLCNSTNSVDVRSLHGEPLPQIDRGEPIVDIGAYCLMPNHFHILAHETRQGGISLFMRKVSTAYSMYFNMKYGRTGKLFENTFKAVHADDDAYLHYLFAYIHLNPVKLLDPKWRERGVADRTGAKQYLSKYVYSSYLDYTGDDRDVGLILNRGAFPEYFSVNVSFESFIDDWLAYSVMDA